MRTFLLCLLVLGVGFVLELAMRHLPLASVRIDAGWIIVLYMGFYVSLFPGALGVLVVGLAQESLGGSFHGILPLSYLMVFFFLRATHQQLFFQGGAPQMFWVMILTFLQRGIESGLLAWKGYGVPYDGVSSLVPLAFTALLHGLVSLILFPFLRGDSKISSLHAT